jgi:hypothetical protein
MQLSNAAVIVFLVSLVCSHVMEAQTPDYSVIAIQYVGEQDKPISPLVISDSKAGAEWYRQKVMKEFWAILVISHVISHPSFEKLVAAINSFERPVQRDKNASAELNGIEVRVMTGSRKDVFFYERKTGLLFLEKLRQSSTNKTIRADILNFERRLDAMVFQTAR